MTSEPPSRIPPKGQSHETKSARDEISSKGKVEKVREVDADETRKRKFLKYFDEDQLTEADSDTENRPSPFDLLSGRAQPQETETEEPLASRASFNDVEDAIIPSPSYTPPPDLSSMNTGEEGADEDASENALPRSDGFWEDVDFPPEQQTPPRTLQENPQTQKSFQEPGITDEPGPSTSAKKKHLAATAKAKSDKKDEFSPFGPPGKPVKPEKGLAAAKPEKKGTAPPASKDAEKKKLPTPFEEAAATAKSMKPTDKKKQISSFEDVGPKTRALEKEEERYLGGHALPEKKSAKEKATEQGTFYQEPGAIPLKPDEREGGSGGGKRGREQKIVEIESPSLPALPASVQPIAAAAASQATSYIHPSTVSLFFQMVGTMYVMAGPQGINRTEIVLNNPLFAGSKFFGATIRIEKYATAPDSFNITLSGSDEAVTSFKDNIPSLMAAFQNGNFAFKVTRLDVEYTLERPVYRRKEKGEEKGEAGGGDLGERRK